MDNKIEVLKEVSLELKNGTLGKDLELGHIEQLLEIGIYKLQKKGYFKNKKALLALEKLDRLEKWLDDVEDFETKGFTDTLKKTLYGNLVGTCKIREIINYPKKEVCGVLEK